MNKKTHPNETLELVLELVNLVKTSAGLPSGYALQQSKKGKVGKNLNAAFRQMENSINRQVKQIKNETKQYPALLSDISKIFCKIRKMDYDPEDYFGDLLNYRDFLRFRINMWDIAAAAAAMKSQRNSIDLLNMHYSSIPFSLRMKITGQKTIAFEKDILMLALEDADLDRIRICGYCKRIYWAYYVNSSGCTKRCIDNLRKRQDRARKREVIARMSRPRTKQELS